MQLPCRRLRRPRRVFRHGPAASCSAPMASRLRGLNPYSGGCLPCCRDRLDRRDSSGFDQGLCLSRRAPRCFRRSREAAALPCSMPTPPVLTGRRMAHPSIRPRRLSAAWRIRAQCRRISPATPECRSIPEAARGRRPPSYGSPRPRRIPAGCLGFPSLVGMAPDRPPEGGPRTSARIAPAPKRHQRRVLSSLFGACAPGRFSAPSLPDSRDGHPSSARWCGTLCPTNATVVTGRALAADRSDYAPLALLASQPSQAVARSLFAPCGAELRFAPEPRAVNEAIGIGNPPADSSGPDSLAQNPQ